MAPFALRDLRKAETQAKAVYATFITKKAGFRENIHHRGLGCGWNGAERFSRGKSITEDAASVHLQQGIQSEIYV